MANYQVGMINYDGVAMVQLTELDKEGNLTNVKLEEQQLDVSGVLTVDSMNRVVLTGKLTPHNTASGRGTTQPKEK